MIDKKSVIFGISGQDGSYLADYLLKKKYKVFGISRSKSSKNLINLKKLKINSKIKVFKIDQYNKKELFSLLKKIKPKEIYCLSGQSSVAMSFKYSNETYLSNIITLSHILEFCRLVDKKIKVYNSVSSECFGNNKKILCNEKTSFMPISPYGKAKAFSFWLANYYRKKFNLNISNGILFNHESSLRKNHFVIKKIIDYAQNFNSKSKKLVLGNINVFRDWGWAPEFINIIYKINSQKKNSNYVVGTGKLNSLKNFIKIVFKEKKIPLDKIHISKNFYRRDEIKKICSKPTRIIKEFRWKPKYNIHDIAKKMLNNDLF